MLTSVQGVYREGKVELSEPTSANDGTPVIVTFLTTGNIDLRALGISEGQAHDLRHRLAAFVEDWDNPAMAVYDHYYAVEPKK